MAEIKRCREPFATEHNGMTRVIAAGDLVSTDDPVYNKATADHFEDVDVHVDEQKERRATAEGRRVEQATAAPGEKRSVSPAGEPDPDQGDGKESKSEASDAASSSDKAPARRPRRTTK